MTLEKWCERNLLRQLSKASIENIREIAEAFERFRAANDEPCRIVDISNEAGAEGTELYEKLSGQWWRALSAGLVNYAARRAGGSLELVCVRHRIDEFDAYQLVTRDAPHLVVACAVVRGTGDASALAPLYEGVRTVSLSLIGRVTIYETERVFAPRDHPLRDAPGNLELALRLDGCDACPPPLSDPRQPGGHPVGGPAALLLAAAKRAGRRFAALEDPAKGLGKELLCELGVTGPAQLALTRPRPWLLGGHHHARAQIDRLGKLRQGMKAAVELGPVGDRETLECFVLPAKGTAAQNLVLARQAVRVAEMEE
jgi:hypothetical protein